MNLYIDTETNGFGGELISIALVADDESEWYRVLPCIRPTEWVQANVIPVLRKRPCSKDITVSSRRMSMSLGRWLRRFRSVHVTADYPTDLEHFCRALVVGSGEYILTPPLTLELRHDLPSISALSRTPHNALEDARALRQLCRRKL